MDLVLENRPEGSTLVVQGEVDHDNVDELAQAVRALAERDGPDLHLDFAQVTYIDSAGLAVIYDLLGKHSGQGIIEITGVSPDLLRLLSIAGLTVQEGLRICPDQSCSQVLRPPGRLAAVGWDSGSWSRQFPPDLAELAHIRAFVEEVAARISLDKERVYDLKIAVSEAAANAMEHGRDDGDLLVSGTLEDGRLTFSVAHPGTFRHAPQADPCRANRGRGLPLMVALTDTFTVSRPKGGGTIVMLSIQLN